MPKPGGVICHAVAVATNVGDFVVVAVVAAMEAAAAAHVGGRTRDGLGSLLVLADSCSVVAEGGQCELS